MCNFAVQKQKTMAEFKIGDKVNFLSTVGGGKVTKIIDSRMVMVEVEDGFEIPTLITDLVLDYRSMPAPSKQQENVEKVQKEIQGQELLKQQQAEEARKGGLRRFAKEAEKEGIYTLDGHVLRDFHSVRTPRSDHFTTWTYKESLQIVLAFWASFAIQPAKLIGFISGELMVYLRGNHTLRWCSEKVNHKFVCLKIYRKGTTFFPNPHHKTA